MSQTCTRSNGEREGGGGELSLAAKLLGRSLASPSEAMMRIQADRLLLLQSRMSYWFEAQQPGPGNGRSG